MNYILNNKLKFEKNKYNKQVLSNTTILTRNLNKISPPLNLDRHIPINTHFSSNPYGINFKLKNYQTNNFIQQIQPENKIQDYQNQDYLKIKYIESNESVESNESMYYKTDELIVNIYGYDYDYSSIVSPLNNKTLYIFLLELSKHVKIKIYIHTWNIDKSVIEYYFQGLNVVWLLIDECDLNEKDNSGNIFSSSISLYSWKLMWTSMFRSINEIYKNEDDRTIILNTRFDINYNFNINNFIDLTKNKFTKNIFLKDSTDLSGVDNPIIGDKNTLQKLINTFYNYFDNVVMFYSSFKVPEAAIYYENNRLFGINYKDMFENIEKYSK